MANKLCKHFTWKKTMNLRVVHRGIDWNGASKDILQQQSTCTACGDHRWEAIPVLQEYEMNEAKRREEDGLSE